MQPGLMTINGGAKKRGVKKIASVKKPQKGRGFFYAVGGLEREICTFSGIMVLTSFAGMMNLL